MDGRRTEAPGLSFATLGPSKSVATAPTEIVGASLSNSNKNSSGEGPNPKDLWDKADITGRFLGSILIPIVVTAGGFFVSNALQDRAAKEKAAEIAVTILQSKDPPPDLKAWATGVFTETLARAAQPLSPGALKELKNAPLPSPGYSFEKVGFEGSFKKEGDLWKEYPPYAPGEYFTFKELSQDADFIYLVDSSRTMLGDPNNPMLVRLPKRGGPAQWSYKDPISWKDFLAVGPEAAHN